MPHMATVQLPVDGILGRDMAEEVPVRVIRTLWLQAVLAGHVLDEEASGTIFHRIVLIMRKYLLQFRTVRTGLEQGGFKTGGFCAGTENPY